MLRLLLSAVVAVGLTLSLGSPAFAEEPPAADPAKTPATLKDATDAKQAGNIAWVIAATGLVMFMMPGLALFYGGMVRRKNVLGTMMHTMIALGIVGVQWAVVGYCLAFGASQGGYIGWSPELLLLSPEAVWALDCVG